MKLGDAKQAARCIDALRRGWTILIESEKAAPGSALTLKAIERASDTDYADAPDLLLSASRAAVLKLANQKAAADKSAPIRLFSPVGLNAATAMAIADPVQDLASPLKGPFRAAEISDESPARVAIELARLAGLLPAFLVLDEQAPYDDRCSAEDVAAYNRTETLYIAARARLPVASSENAEIVAFRNASDATDHVALIIGTPDESLPVVRLHSECLTGDILGSLKCDCGPQLHHALAQMSVARWGVLLYLRQEGRGIGLINKLRAYQLQDQGFDTVDANTRLGFAIDARQFTLAAQMLRLLNIQKLRLLTNNPLKVSGLEAESLHVVERLPVKIAPNPHNERYLDTKRDRTGHQL